LTDQWSIGVTGKAITEDIADASARAIAGDAGTLYKLNDRITLGVVLANLGTAIKFVDASDPLPLAFRAGAYVRVLPALDVSAEAVLRRTGLASGSAGVQWRYGQVLTLRAGLDSSHTNGLSAVSAFRAGVGIRVFGQEFAYAWVPYSDLGNAHYFSLDFRFGGSPEADNPSVIKATSADSSDDPLFQQLNADYSKGQN
jgi:hypothetical protein